ncbi:hypothetical protein CDIK_2828 [Cucumispora dikerogammari]|nr:hypothetical protein CDIK_2828 [Cucumispora dikerogammari]
MISRISFVLGTSDFKARDFTMLLIKPRSIIIKSGNTLSLDSFSTVPDNFKFIEAVVDLTNFTSTKTNTTIEEAIVTGLKTIPIKIITEGSERRIVSQEALLSSETSLNLLSLRKACSRKGDTDLFVLSFQQEGGANTKSLFTYLETRPTNGFKISFSGLKIQAEDINVNIIKAIENIEKDIDFLMKLVDNKRPMSIDEKRQFGLAKEETVEKLISEIRDFQNIDEDLKIKIIHRITIQARKERYTILKKVSKEKARSERGKRKRKIEKTIRAFLERRNKINFFGDKTDKNYDADRSTIKKKNKSESYREDKGKLFNDERKTPYLEIDEEVDLRFKRGLYNKNIGFNPNERLKQRINKEIYATCKNTLLPKTKIDLKTADRDLYIAVLLFVERRLRKEIENFKYSISFKHTILCGLKREFDKLRSKKVYLLSDTIKQIKEKLSVAKYNVSFETPIFTLNTETNSLEELTYKKNTGMLSTKRKNSIRDAFSYKKRKINIH